MNKDEILKQGFVIVKVTVAGIRQTHRLDVVKEKSGNGYFHYLRGRHPIPESEMIRLAEELQLPIRSKDTLVFPKGKSRQDFTEISITQPTIEAEIED
ncbi:MAG: hypothetical protein QW153_01125 [Candidatus Bilamarchaeaceae archaeon]